MDEWKTILEAAKELGIAEHKIYTAIRRKKLDTQRCEGRMMVKPKQILETFRLDKRPKPLAGTHVSAFVTAHNGMEEVDASGRWEWWVQERSGGRRVLWRGRATEAEISSVHAAIDGKLGREAAVLPPPAPKKAPPPSTLPTKPVEAHPPPARTLQAEAADIANRINPVLSAFTGQVVTAEEVINRALRIGLDHIKAELEKAEVG